MKALLKANPETQGVPYRCLDMATRVFGVRNEYQYATKAWDAAKYKHPPSEPLPDVPVLVWFSWWGSIPVDGYGDWGHVAVWFPDKGLLSSPFNYNVTQQWFASPEKLISYLGSGTYVGWSEDINDVRIATPNMEDGMTTQDANALLDSIWWNLVGRKIKPSELDEYAPIVVGGNPDKVIKKVLTFDEAKAHLGKLVEPASIDKDSILVYLASNLK